MPATGKGAKTHSGHVSGVPGTGGTAVCAYCMSVYVYMHTYVCVYACSWETRGSRGQLLDNFSVDGLCGWPCAQAYLYSVCVLPLGVHTRSSFQLSLGPWSCSRLTSVRLLDS